MSRATWVNFRASRELTEALDEWCDAHGLNRSAGARLLIESALSDDSESAVLSSAVYSMSGALKAAAKRALAEAVERLPAFVDEELRAAR